MCGYCSVCSEHHSEGRKQGQVQWRTTRRCILTKFFACYSEVLLAGSSAREAYAPFIISSFRERAHQNAGGRGIVGERLPSPQALPMPSLAPQPGPVVLMSRSAGTSFAHVSSPRW